LHCSQSACNSHLKLPAPTSSKFKDFINPYLSAQDTQEGKPQLREFLREGGVKAIFACCITTALANVKINLVIEICDKILRLEFIEAFILETVEICMKGVTSGRAVSHVNMSPEIGQSGMQGAPRSSVLEVGRK
jgi:hypothetical protein